MKKILVTGADGFIGKALSACLLGCGYDVLGAVINEGASRSLVGGVKPVITGDITGDVAWPGILKGVDAVVHLAARVHVMKESAKDPLSEFIKVNAQATKKIAEEAARAGVRKFVLMSSVKVNGEETFGRPFLADDSPMPRDPYGISKMMAEKELFSVCESSGMNGIAIRPTLVYGPGVGGNFLRLLGWVKRGVPLPLGSVKNKRSFVYVENLCDAVRCVIENQTARNEVFLVSDGKDVSTPELIKAIAGAMDKKARLFNVAPGALDRLGSFAGKHEEVRRLTGSLCVDTKKIRDMIGWQAPFSFDEGIRETAGWFKTSHKAQGTGHKIG